jgi:hypothetical protein
MDPIGVMTRNEAHASGAWHRGISCWVIRPVDDGYVIFQKRNPIKDDPNVLDTSAAGHYQTGENAQMVFGRSAKNLASMYVQIRIADGLRLFTGLIETIPASGILWQQDKGIYLSVRIYGRRFYTLVCQHYRDE